MTRELVNAICRAFPGTCSMAMYYIDGEPRAAIQICFLTKFYGYAIRRLLNRVSYESSLTRAA